jgi:hypothetical protein
MVNETNLAKYVNIVKSNATEIPNDVYSYMVNKINDEINDTIKIDPSLINLRYINYNRTFIKISIMTIPYGASIREISDQIKNDFFIFNGIINKKYTYKLKDNTFNKENTNFYLKNHEIIVLARILHDILYKSFPSLGFFVKYLKLMNKFLKDLKLNTV